MLAYAFVVGGPTSPVPETLFWHARTPIPMPYERSGEARLGEWLSGLLLAWEVDALRTAVVLSA